jgi:hypothetical protein
LNEFGEQPVARHNPALVTWVACTIALLGPSLLVWAIRIVGYAESCAPGPDPCHGIVLGGGLRDALALAWVLPTNVFLLLLVAVAATIAGILARRPLLAATCLLILPIAALLLPMLAVSSARYDGCTIDESGIGDCVLWGANMGMSFHTAAQVPGLVYDFAPYSFSLALMLGLLGWFFSQPRAAKAHPMARMRRLERNR